MRGGRRGEAREGGERKKEGGRCEEEGERKKEGGREEVEGGKHAASPVIVKIVHSF